MNEDVRYRLSAEGVADVVAAFKKIQSESTKSAGAVEKGFGGFGRSLAGIKGMLGAVGIAIAAADLGRLVIQASQLGESLQNMSRRFQTSASDLSALRVVAERTGGSLEDFAPALTNLFATMKSASADLGGEAADNFRKLGLSTKEIKNFANQDLAQRLETLGRALVKLPEGPQRADAAIAVLGVRGAKLVPILEEIGTKGFRGLRSEAASLSSLLSDDMVRSLSEMNDAMDDTKLQVQGLTAQFAASLGPSFTSALRGMQAEVAATEGGWQKLGQVVGVVIAAIIGTVTAAVDIIGTRLRNIYENLGSMFRYYGALFIGDLHAAETELSRIKARNQADAQGLNERLKNLYGATFEGKGKGPSKALGPTPEEAAQAAADARAAEEASSKARAAARRAGIEAELSVARAGIKFEQDQAQIAFEAGLLSLKQYYDGRRALVEQGIAIEKAALGKQRAEAVSDGQKGLADVKKLNGELTVLAIERQGQMESLAAEEAKKLREFAVNSLASQFDDADRSMSTFARDRAAIEDRAQAGLLSQAEADKRILDLETARLEQLRFISDELIKAAEASGDPDRIAKAQDFAMAVDQVSLAIESQTNELRRLATGGIEIAQNALSDFLGQGISEAPTFAAAISNMARSVAQSVQQMIGHFLALKIVTGFLGMFGGGGGGIPGEASGAVYAADGGLISGPGTSTSDSIPARLSAGEFVVRAAAVSQPGAMALLEALNGGAMDLHPIQPRPRHFALGGLVEASGGGAGGAGASLDATLGLEEGLVVKHLETAAGERAVIRILAKNKRSASRALGIS